MPPADLQPTRRLTDGTLLRFSLVLAVGLAFTTLAWTSQRHIGMLWDELVDQRIAEGLLDHPLYGIGDDGSQMRLPMTVNALAFAVAGPSLPLSRGISIAVGLTTILATFLLCRRLFDGWTAVLASAILGFSPYFLGFARISMTEGDVFPGLMVTLSCWAYVGYARDRTGPRLALTSIMLGLAIGAKLYAAFLIPVLGMCEFIDSRARVRVGPPTTNATASDDVIGSSRWIVLVAVVAVLLAAISAGLAQMRMVGPSITVWAVLPAVTVSTLIAVAITRRWRPGGSVGWIVMSLLAVAVACAAIPQHVLNPDILRTLARRTVHWDHALPDSMWLDHVRLYTGLILIGATVPVGVATVFAIVWAWARENVRPQLRLPIFAISFFVLALSTLPLRQTFYLMTVWPLLAIITSAGLMSARQWLTDRRPAFGTAFTVVILLLALQQAATAVYAWPDYNLYPRRWVSSRWLGAETRGYRNLVQTPCDGYAELVEWCLANVRPGQRVVSYLWADHVLDTLLPDDLPFTLVRRGIYDAADRDLPKPPPPAVDQADYVLLHINNFVEYRDIPHPDVFAERFDREPVFKVCRDGDFTMAVIYGRRPASSDTATQPAASSRPAATRPTRPAAPQ